MLTLQTLRQARTFARWVLAWFVLSVGLAVAAPLVQPQSSMLVCSAAGEVKLLVGDDDGSTPAGHHLLNCVLCLALGAPPVAQLDVVAPIPPLAHALRGTPAAHIAWRTASPLPPRGPPAFS